MRKNSSTAGIDCGTNGSSIAMLDQHGIPVAIKNSDGKESIRSAVLFQPGAPAIIGQQALNASILYPTSLAREMKLHIGEKDTLGNDLAIVTDSEGKLHTAVECQGMVAECLIKTANAQIASPITDIVLSVPVNYGNVERTTLMAIGKQVGCNILGLVEEPVAVGYTFVNMSKGSVDGIYLVFDAGAGTTDLAVLEITGGNPRIRFPKGKPNLGGRRFDMALIEVIKAKAGTAGIDIEKASDPATLHEFHEKVETAKLTLTESEKALFYMNFEGKILKTELLRSDFEKASKPILTEMRALVQDTLGAAKLDPKDLKGILLNGPSCQMPMIQAMLAEVLPGVPLRRDVNPVTAVAQGAALVACKYAQQDGSDPVSKDGTQVRVSGSLAAMPAVATRALGCECIRGRDTSDKYFSIIIPANSPLPATKSDTFGLINEHQTAADVKVYEGQEGMSLDQCVYITTLRLDGIPEGKLDQARIEVKYSFDRSGVLKVVATDTVSKKSVSTDVTHNMRNC